MVYTNVKIKETHNGPYTINSSATTPRSFQGTLRVPDKRAPLKAEGSATDQRKACRKSGRVNT